MNQQTELKPYQCAVKDSNAITLDERFRWICQARNDLLYACKKAEANIRLRGDEVKMTSTLEVLQRAIARHDVPDWDKIIAESVAKQRKRTFFGDSVEPYEGSAEHKADLKDDKAYQALMEGKTHL